MAGVALGIGLNVSGKEAPFYGPVLYAAQLAGKGVFVNLLKMVIIPLIFTSIVVGIANLRAHEQIGKVWRLTLTYFFCSTSLAIILGLVVVNIARPGIGLSIDLADSAATNISAQTMSLPEYIKEFIAGMFRNPVAAMAQGDILPTLIFAIFLGIGLIVAGDENAKTLLRLFKELYEIIMMLVGWIMKLLPWGLLGLLTDLFATQDIGLLRSLGKFMLVVSGATWFAVTMFGLVALVACLAGLWLWRRRPVAGRHHPPSQ